MRAFINVENKLPFRPRREIRVTWHNLDMVRAVYSPEALLLALLQVPIVPLLLEAPFEFHHKVPSKNRLHVRIKFQIQKPKTPVKI